MNEQKEQVEKIRGAFEKEFGRFNVLCSEINGWTIMKISFIKISLGYYFVRLSIPLDIIKL